MKKISLQDIIIQDSLEDSLLENASIKTILHLFIAPLFITSLDSSFAIYSVFYIALISFLHVYRCHINPTKENLFRKDLYFSFMSSLVLGLFCLFLVFIRHKGGNFSQL